MGNGMELKTQKNDLSVIPFLGVVGVLMRLFSLDLMTRTASTSKKKEREQALELRAYQKFLAKLEVEDRMKNQSQMLFKLIEETMANAGYLSGSYSYKVMAQGTFDKRYTILLVVPKIVFRNTTAMLRAECSIKDSARHTLPIVVQFVYWSCKEDIPRPPVANATEGVEVTNDEPASDAQINAFQQLLAVDCQPSPTAAEGWQDTEVIENF